MLLLTVEANGQGVSLRVPELVETSSGQMVRFRVDISRTFDSDPAHSGNYQLLLEPGPGNSTALEGATLDSLTGEFRWAVQAQHEGREFTYLVRLVQNTKTLATASGRIRVSSEVPAPVLQLPETVLLEANARNNPVQMEAYDPAARPLNITVSSTLPNTVQYRQGSREIVFPIQTESRYTVTVTADNGVKRVQRKLEVTVARSNVQRPPSFYQESDNVVVGERERVNVNVSAFDPNSGDVIFYSIRNSEALNGQARIPDNRQPMLEFTAGVLVDKDEETYVVEVVADDRISPNPPVKRVSVTVRRNITYAEQSRRTYEYLREFAKLQTLEAEGQQLYTCLLKKDKRSRLTRRVVGGLTVTASLIGGVWLLSEQNNQDAVRTVGFITAGTSFLSGVQNIILPDNINQDIDALANLNRELLQFRSEEQVNNRDNMNQLARTEDYFRVYKNLLIRNMVFEGRLRPIQQRVPKNKCR